ncbi:cysteine proteinase inhibitor [Canna indica]|uniref:Cysteine proteinase inhibitor n=1 Tax=Canna indica TaxID=4628 RepID=A0AAQ3Q4P3_9LILI|nr:cysteine proteinase inhibitor [Canna indica]
MDDKSKGKQPMIESDAWEMTVLSQTIEEPNQDTLPEVSLSQLFNIEFADDEEDLHIKHPIPSERETRIEMRKRLQKNTGTRVIPFVGDSTGASTPKDVPFSPHKKKSQKRAATSGNQLKSTKEKKIEKLKLLSSSIVISSFLFATATSDLDRMTTVGGISNAEGASNDAEIEQLARFAVDEHNKKENALLEFGRVVKAREQVVAGTMHHLTVEAIDAGKKKIFEAKVWVKPWLNFKELQEFRHAGDSS